MNKSSASDLIAIDRIRSRIYAELGDSAPNLIRGARNSNSEGFGVEVGILSSALHDDDGYAWAYHCRIAMLLADTLGISHAASNYEAAVIMAGLFSKEDKFLPYWTTKEFKSTLLRAHAYADYRNSLAKIKLADILGTGENKAWSQFKDAIAVMHKLEISIDNINDEVNDLSVFSLLKKTAGSEPNITRSSADSHEPLLSEKLKHLGIRSIMITYEPTETEE